MAEKTDQPRSLLENFRMEKITENVDSNERVRFRPHTPEEFSQFLDDLQYGRCSGEMLIKDPRNPERNIIFKWVPKRTRKKK